MQTEEKNLSHTESLAIIRNMITVAKNNFTDNGFHFLLWGVLVILASLGQYFLAVVIQTEHNDLPWLAMPIVGAPIAFIYEWRKGKHEKVKTHFDRIFTYLWMAVGITLFLVIFLSVKNQMSPIPFILTIVGLGAFVSGNILNFKSLIFGAIVFWVAAILAGFAAPLNQLLINAVATFIGYIIPGILLWRSYKTQVNV
ncbi:MAG: hypothetical protein JWO06_1213 [Bacteroidota bacterium]|nr:hypothetical protein [Bacteroidota bacterium]